MKIYISLKKRLEDLPEKIYRAMFPVAHATKMQEIIENRLDWLWRWEEEVVDAEADLLIKQLMEAKFYSAATEIYELDETMLEREVRSEISKKVLTLAVRIKSITEYKVAK